MIICDCARNPISSTYFRLMLRDLEMLEGVKPSLILLHVEQEIAAENNGFVQAAVVKNESPALVSVLFPPKQACGIPMEARIDFPKDEIHFLSAGGACIGKLVNLAKLEMVEL